MIFCGICCRYLELLKAETLLESYGDPLFYLQLRLFFVSSLLTESQSLSPIIYCHEPGRSRFSDPEEPDYWPRSTRDDSMWLLFLGPGRFCWAEGPEQRAAILREPERFTKLQLGIARDLKTKGTNALLKEFGLDKMLTPQTWFCLVEHRARFEVAMPQPKMPPLCPEVQAEFKEMIQRMQSEVVDVKKIQEEQLEYGVLTAEFIEDLRLILKQMDGRTGAERFIKITATEKNMKSDLGRALLRELQAASKASPSSNPSR